MTKNQTKLLIFIEEYRQENGVAPSYREIARNIDVSSVRSVYIIVDALLKKQYLATDTNLKFRSLRLTDKGKKIIGKNSLEVRFHETFPSYRRSLPFTIPTTEASIPSNAAMITYKNSSLKTNGTTVPKIKSVSSKGKIGNKSDQPSLFNGTSKRRQSLVNIQNTTINFPLHSVNLPKLDGFIRDNDYLVIVLISFTLIKIFNEKFLWFVILLVSMVLIKKINNYLEE